MENQTLESMKKLLTIVIPAYNMELYIGRCLDSLFNTPQNIRDKFEVIVINDGSKDGTLQIINQYAVSYDNCHVIDKINGGWGSAINLGIQKASGKYFKILDSDDWFDSQSLMAFVNLLETIDVDLVATSFSYEYANGEEKVDIYEKDLCNKIMPFTEYLSKCHCEKHLPMATIAFRTKILQNNQIQVCERYYADIDYNLTPLLYVGTIYFSQINLYRYYIGRDGQSANIEGYRKHIDDFINVCEKIVAYYSEHTENIHPIIRKAYLKDACNIIRFAYDLLMSPTYNQNISEPTKRLKELDCFIKSHSKELYKKSSQIKKKHIPYIRIWRFFGINLLKIRK